MEGRYQQRRRRNNRGEGQNRPPKGSGAQEDYPKKEVPPAPQPPHCGSREPHPRKESPSAHIPPSCPCKEAGNHGKQQGNSTFPMGLLPTPLNALLSGSRSGDLMALMILLLLLWEGKEDSKGTILTLLIFLLL